MEWGQNINVNNADHQSEQNEETYPLFYLNDSEEATDDDSKNNFHKETRVDFVSNRGNQKMFSESSVIEMNTSSVICPEKDYKMHTSPDDASFLSEKRKNDRISFINFGGQNIFYAFHQIYLSPNAVYILVMDMTKGFDEKEPSSLHNVLAQFETWTYKGR